MRPKMLAVHSGLLLLTVVLCHTVFISAEDRGGQTPPNGLTQQLWTPFHINVSSSCPPAMCFGFWNGGPDDEASGNTDFRPAGVPIQFQFQTGPPVTYQCDQQHEHCTSTYNSGTFTATGPAGTFNGTITSGTATFFSDRYIDLNVSFSGQWSTGQHMTGAADWNYQDQFGGPGTYLLMSMAPGASDTPAK